MMITTAMRFHHLCVPVFLAIVWAGSILVDSSQAAAPVNPPANADSRENAAKLFQELRSGKLRPLDANISLNLIARVLSDTDDQVTQTALLQGMLAGLEGQRNVKPPKGWSDINERLSVSSSDQVTQLTLSLSQIFGDKAAAQTALAALQDPSTPLEERQAALRSLVSAQNSDLPPVIEALLSDEALRLDAIRAYASIKVDNAPSLLLGHYSDFDPPSQRALIETLASREEYATVLLKALKQNKISREAIPSYVARSLSQLLGKPFTDVYGDIDALSADKEQLIARYRGLLTTDAVSKGNAFAGREVFERTCAACHIIYGKGGKIGPDLTGSNRADLDYILLNMLDPSGDIPDAYKLVTLTTKSGQILAGTIANEDDQRIVLNSVGIQSTVLKSDIEERQTSPYSMMPEGLLLATPDKDVINLVKYLRSTQQVEAKP